MHGTVTFSQSTPSDNVTIVVDLQGLPTTPGLTWEVHELPVPFLSPSQRCLPDSVGRRYDPDGRFTNANGSYSSDCSQDSPQLCEIGDLTGRQGDFSNGIFVDGELSLTGVYSILGRSLVIRKSGGLTICATIGRNATMVTAVARLQGLISGEIYFRQSAVDSSSDSTIFVQLRGNIGGGMSSVSWSIHEKRVPSNRQTTGTQCIATGAVFDPDGAMQSVEDYQQACSSATPHNCSTGDLSGKHGLLSLNDTSQTQALFTDSSLSLSGILTVIGRSLVVRNSTGQRIACGNIYALPMKSATATFDYSGVQGTVQLSQRSPWDATTLHVQVSGLNQQAGGYHVHQYPVPIAQSDSSADPLSQFCSPTAVGGHWNPFNAAYPGPASGTQDMYEIGDLSGKFGSLSGQRNTTMEFQDWFLPLFGPYSVVGRSIVIHRSLPKAPRWTCATILQDNALVKTAVVRFTYPVAGDVLFLQDVSWALGETIVISRLQRSDGQPASANHNWHVHEMPIPDSWSGSRCSSAGGHYNPFSVNTAKEQYSITCTNNRQLGCELGDLTGKSKPLSFDNSSTTSFFYTDRNLPLGGLYSIVGRSVVIHTADRGSGRLACANITLLSPQQTRAVFSMSGVNGQVSFSQSTPFSPTLVQVVLNGLLRLAGGYHIHELPVPAASGPAMPDCSATAGHFNPFNVQYNNTPPPIGSTLDKYEMGDLSGKFGSLSSASSVNASFSDSRFLPLSGSLRITGRSVVIHHPNGSRWLCSTLMTTSSQLTTVASFSTATFSATITMQQPSGSPLSPTTILVVLQAVTSQQRRRRRQALSAGTTLNWSVAAATSSTGASCSNAPLSDPQNMAKTTDYAQRCSPSNQQLCSSADLTGKHGALTVPSSGTQRYFFTDLNLPLSGSNSGRTKRDSGWATVYLFIVVRFVARLN